jgi:hypothetical protein
MALLPREQRFVHEDSYDLAEFLLHLEPGLLQGFMPVQQKPLFRLVPLMLESQVLNVY